MQLCLGFVINASQDSATLLRTKRGEVDRSLLDDLKDEASDTPTTKIPPIKVMHPTPGPRALELDSEGKTECF